VKNAKDIFTNSIDTFIHLWRQIRTLTIRRKRGGGGGDEEIRDKIITLDQITSINIDKLIFGLFQTKESNRQNVVV